MFHIKGVARKNTITKVEGVIFGPFQYKDFSFCYLMVKRDINSF